MLYNMVDPQISKNQPNREEKLKNFMGKTPALLKSKLLSVLDSSNELLNDISNRVSFHQVLKFMHITKSTMMNSSIKFTLWDLRDYYIEANFKLKFPIWILLVSFIFTLFSRLYQAFVIGIYIFIIVSHTLE